MLINIQDDIIRLHAAGLLTRLLADKTTGKNIMWATDAYAEHGTKYERNEQIMPELITGSNTGIIKTRARKVFEQQTERTRRRAEVFTPLWICKNMTEHYYTECASGQDTDKLINSRQLEITCGEAPFLVSRYDTTTGEPIPIAERIGLLDRKLQLAGKIAEDEADWLNLARRAVESTYGYEFQGDNLLIARVNLIETFSEYMQDCWHREPTPAKMRPIINIVTWNVWQMDGLNGRIPYKTADEDNVQLSFFEEEAAAPEQPPCKIFDWRARRPLEYNVIGKGNKTMKFDFVMGNPPYQEEKKSDSPRDLPIYDKFMSATYKISDKVLLITPARFLFNAGFTSKEWNNTMLSDEHLKVVFFEPNSSAVFANTQIPGGVAITYRDRNKVFGKIGEFIPYAELVSIMAKCKSDKIMSDLISSRDLFHYSDCFFEKYPEKKAINNYNNVVNSNAFDKFEDVFTEKPTRKDDICFLGRYHSKRENRYILKEYIDYNPYISQCKVVFAQTNGGAGTITDEKAAAVMGEPTVYYEMSGFTDSFICVGLGDNKSAADNCAKYIRTKFMRALLATLKRTGSITKDKWANIPQQDFTDKSDIDWSKSIPDIDKQLYKKYGLTDDEITFIETHVKEMS
ncbi:MAG: Eco57I restriction-modification methylase domain-containing protein [Ruminiclostridium sp.]|nr:Eco57I restriction-modification methylase domain-containing protein [Ruminiclostridium sp.]